MSLELVYSKWAPRMIFFNEKKSKDSDYFWQRKLTWKFRILQFLTTFTQLNARLKTFLRGLKEAQKVQKYALNSQLQALQILENDDEVENWSLSSFFLAVIEVSKFLNIR